MCCRKSSCAAYVGWGFAMPFRAAVDIDSAKIAQSITVGKLNLGRTNKYHLFNVKH